MNGKQKRMGKILENGKAVIIPMDHGATDGVFAIKRVGGCWLAAHQMHSF